MSSLPVVAVAGPGIGTASRPVPCYLPIVNTDDINTLRSATEKTLQERGPGPARLPGSQLIALRRDFYDGSTDPGASRDRMEIADFLSYRRR